MHSVGVVAACLITDLRRIKRSRLNFWSEPLCCVLEQNILLSHGVSLDSHISARNINGSDELLWKLENAGERGVLT